MYLSPFIAIALLLFSISVDARREKEPFVICGLSYSDRSLRWTQLEKPPTDKDFFLTLSKDGVRAKEWIAKSDGLDAEAWFTRDGDLLVCEYRSYEYCSRSTRTVHFKKDEIWKVEAMANVICMH